MGSRSSTTDPGSPSTVIVGKIRRAHGVRGEVVVESLTDVPGRFERDSELWLTRGDDGGPVLRTLRVAASRPHREALLVRFEGLEDRDAAAELRDLYLEARPMEPPGELEEGTFLHYQLHGCRCRDRELGDLGTVVDLVEDGGGLLLIVEGERGLVPVPFVRAFLVEVDVEGKRIELDLPAGLLESCASGS